MNKKMETLPKFEQLFSKIKKSFNVSGLPLDRPNVYFQFYVIYFCLIITVCEELCYFLSRIAPENILELTELLPCMSVGALAAVKSILLASKKQKIISLTACLKNLYKINCSDKRKSKLISPEVTTVNALIKYYFILNAILIFVYNFSVLFFMAYNILVHGKVTYLLPYAILTPYKIDNWVFWLLTYIQSITGAFACVLFFTMSDAIFCLFTSQVCINFAVLSDEIKHLDENTQDFLNIIVQKHQYLLNLANDLEDIFTLPNLFNYMVGSFEICSLGFSITIGSWSHFPGYILFLISVLLQILMMSVFGENILKESKRVGDAAYQCQWHHMSEKSKQILLTIIIRSQKQQQLTANKFTVICHSSFAKIISTSWSYFTILKTMSNP